MVSDAMDWLTVAANVWSVDLLGAIVVAGNAKGKSGKGSFLWWTRRYVEFIGEKALLIAFVIALAATGGSLFLSEVALFAPCKLCWLQRIFMYPLVPILALAVGNNDKRIADYVIALASIGGAIAGYHYLLQRGIVSEITECSTVGYSVSCADNFGMAFGYVTIPMSSLSAFVVILLLMVVVKVAETKKD